MLVSPIAPLAVWALLRGAVFAPSSAAALYFEKVAVKTNSEATCLNFAKGVAGQQHFKNAHSSSSEVAGEYNGAYVAITCVGRGGQQAIAVVMSVAADFAAAKQAGRTIADRIKVMVCIDTPC